MLKIVLKDSIQGAYSSVDGYSLYCLLKPYFLSGKNIVLSMHGFPAMSSSFFNSSFGRLIEENGIDRLKSIIGFSDISQSHANLIRKYIDFYSLEREF